MKLLNLNPQLPGQKPKKATQSANVKHKGWEEGGGCWEHVTMRTGIVTSTLTSQNTNNINWDTTQHPKPWKLPERMTGIMDWEQTRLSDASICQLTALH